MENLKTTSIEDVNAINDEQFKKQADEAEIEARKLETKQILEKFTGIILESDRDRSQRQGSLKMRLTLDIYR